MAEVLEKRGAQKVVKHLLVGFDPVRIYLDCLEQRFGEFATICADTLGGSVISIKWHSQVDPALALKVKLCVNLLLIMLSAITNTGC